MADVRRKRFEAPGTAITVLADGNGTFVCVIRIFVCVSCIVISGRRWIKHLSHSHLLNFFALSLLSLFVLSLLSRFALGLLFRKNPVNLWGMTYKSAT